MQDGEMFSSPAGVLYFKIQLRQGVVILAPFSSPAGVLYFKIVLDELIKNEGLEGFRPLLGFFISKC